jgi:hypothetical protein
MGQLLAHILLHYDDDYDDYDIDGVSRLRPPMGLPLIPQVMYEEEEPCGMMSTGETPDSSTTAQCQSCQQSYSSKGGGTGEENDEFCLMKYLFHTSKGALTCREMLRYGADGFTPIQRKAFCEFLSPLKIHRPRPGLNPRTLGPNTRPLRTIFI